MFMKARGGNIRSPSHFCCLLPLVRNKCRHCLGETPDYNLVSKDPEICQRPPITFK